MYSVILIRSTPNGGVSAVDTGENYDRDQLLTQLAEWDTQTDVIQVHIRRAQTDPE